MTALFAGLLVQPPFHWSFNTLGYVFAGQIATAVAVPFFCGSLSDLIVKKLSKRNGGVTQVCFHLVVELFTVLTHSTARVPAQRSHHPTYRHTHLDNHLR
jgi:hypothetical protein